MFGLHSGDAGTDFWVYVEVHCQKPSKTQPEAGMRAGEPLNCSCLLFASVLRPLAATNAVDLFAELLETSAPGDVFASPGTAATTRFECTGPELA